MRCECKADVDVDNIKRSILEKVKAPPEITEGDILIRSKHAILEEDALLGVDEGNSKANALIVQISGNK